MLSVSANSRCLLFVFASALVLTNYFAEIRSFAQRIPPDEVRTLQIISEKLKNQYWKAISTTSCSDGGPTFNISFALGVFSSVSCDCSFNGGNECHVTHIRLKGLSLSGVLPAEFGNLPHLQEIDLSRNYISGPIPTSLSKIPLVNLALVGNRITGQIPDEIGQIASLEQLVLEDNELGGALPSSLGNLRNLSRLTLPGNYFNGTIPETYSNLKNLTEVRLSGNMISGKIPDFIGNWTKLTTFEIQGTYMEGPIPSSLSLLTNLQTLTIADLSTRSLPFPNLTGMSRLKSLVLRNCSITGPIPGDIGNILNLKLLDLSNNQLNGTIPDSIGGLANLTFLFLMNNSLSGSVPNWIQNSKQNFDVSYNNFTGSPSLGCQSPSVNLISSYSSAKSDSLQWCLRKDLPCTNNARYTSLFINCGGSSMSLEGQTYALDSTSGGASNFYSDAQQWAYSSTGAFQSNDSASFLAETSNPNLTGIYQTARLAPLSLKYYGLCLKPGSYKVVLHFAEIVYSDYQTFASLGRRFFDVQLQGNVVWKDFNIAAAAGGANKPIDKTIQNVNVDDSGTLEIYLYWAGRGTTSIPYRGAYGPLISGITVTPNFKTGSGLSAGAIVGIVLASFVILALVLALFWKRGYFGGKDQEFRGLNTGYFSLRQIKTATDNFSHQNKIGEGGFGPVYKGVLPDGRTIAVKQLSSKSKQGNREFVNEIGMISALQHPNLVKLYGCCIEGKELLLVYEYMENNCLGRALFGGDDQKFYLDWPTRMKICLGIARGLAYLHEESRLKIVHRDIKATNVLLDKDFNAKISDFGLAKLDEEENTHISTRIAGTIGYLAPEYAMRGYLTDKADVYSFGVVVLEIVSGKSNTNYRPKEEFVYLLDWAYVLQEKGNILELVDPSLGSNYSEEEALRLLNLSLLCANPSPSLRPTMSSVVSMIDGKLPIQSPIIKHSGMNDDPRFKSFEIISQETRSYFARGSKHSREIQNSISMDGPWIDSSISLPSTDDVPGSSASSKLLS